MVGTYVGIIEINRLLKMGAIFQTKVAVRSFVFGNVANMDRYRCAKQKM